MTYDFDQLIERRKTDSLKWNVGENELPMWVADMDFKVLPEICEAIQKKTAHGIFGYSVLPSKWYEAYQNWWLNRHNFKIEKNWLVFSAGVIPTISSAVRKLTSVGENVLIMTPVYNIFFNSIKNNGRNVIECPLDYENGKYSINFARLEEELSKMQTTLMILCNPHNPIGRIWTHEELEKIGDLCAKHNVLVISDEIHCDLAMPNKEYVPFASVSENCRNNSVTCIAPTKAFNVAGIQTSAVVVPNKVVRHKIWRALNTDEVGEPNIFAADVAIAAFSDSGAKWLDELREYVYGNYEYVCNELKKNFQQSIVIAPLEATYLMWIDCNAFLQLLPHKDKDDHSRNNNGNRDNNNLAEFIRERTGLFIAAGKSYGKVGENFIRINIACPRARVEEGVRKLIRGLYEFSEEFRIRILPS